METKSAVRKTRGSPHGASAVGHAEQDQRANCPVKVEEPLCEEPDRLTERFTLYTPRSGMASVSNEIKETQNEEFMVRASSEPGPDLLPRGRFLLREWPPSDGTLSVVEAPKVGQLRPPEFVCNLSDKEIPDWFVSRDEVHGSYVVSRSDVLLFGANHLVSQSGLWSCETQMFKRQFMELVANPGFSHFFPGVKPGIEFEGDCSRLQHAKPVRC